MRAARTGIAIAALVGACGEEQVWVVDDHQLQPCELTGCPLGSVCDEVGGSCVPELQTQSRSDRCMAHSDCPLGEACGSSGCSADHCLVVGCAPCEWCSQRTGECLEMVAGDCDPETPLVSGCADDDECASGYACLDGQCYAAHCSVTGCPAASSCDATSGSCGGCDRADYPACTNSALCAPGSLCIEQLCRPVACAGDFLCPAPARCDQGFCAVPGESVCGQ